METSKAQLKQGGKAMNGLSFKKFQTDLAPIKIFIAMVAIYLASIANMATAS